MTSASAGEELCRWRMKEEEELSKCAISAAWLGFGLGLGLGLGLRLGLGLGLVV